MNEQPATKQDIQELKQGMLEFKLELKQDAGERETRLVEKLTEFMRDLETRLLTSFHGYGKGQSALNLEAGHRPRSH